MEYRREQAKLLYDCGASWLPEEDRRSPNSDDRDLKKHNSTEPVRAETDANPRARSAPCRAASPTSRGKSGTFPVPVADTAAQLISPATVPSSPYSPNWTRNLLMALLAGLALGFAVVFIRERLDDRLVGREDLEEASGAPVLAIVPKRPRLEEKNTTKLVARDAPKTAPAEAYRTLADQRRVHGPHERAQDDLDGEPEHGRRQDHDNGEPRRRARPLAASESSQSAATCASPASTASSGSRTTSASRASFATE